MESGGGTLHEKHHMLDIGNGTSNGWSREEGNCGQDGRDRHHRRLWSVPTGLGTGRPTHRLERAVVAHIYSLRKLTDEQLHCRCLPLIHLTERRTAFPGPAAYSPGGAPGVDRRNGTVGVGFCFVSNFPPKKPLLVEWNQHVAKPTGSRRQSSTTKLYPGLSGTHDQVRGVRCNLVALAG